MKKGLKAGLLAGTLACAFAFTTPMLVGCGDDDKGSNVEQQQISLNNTVGGKFVLAMADTLGLRISSTTTPTDAETVIMRAQRYAQNMLKVLDKNSFKLGDVNLKLTMHLLDQKMRLTRQQILIELNLKSRVMCL